LAYGGLGVWALIGQMILNAFFSVIFLWRTSSWRPTLAASRQSFNEMFRFGSRMFAATTLDSVFNNLYIFVIAKGFYISLAGYYFFADRIKDLIVKQLVNSIKTVTYPALATIQSDNTKLKDGYRKVLQVTTFTLFPALSFLAALSKPLFEVLLPDKWAPAAPYLQLLCLASILIPVHTLNLNILQIKGRSDLYLRLEIVKKMMLTVILVISLQFGIFGVLIGRVIASVLGYFPNSYYSSRLIGYSVREQLMDFLPALLLSGVISGLTYLAVTLLDWPASRELAVFGLLALTLYVAAAYVFRMEALGLARRLKIRQSLPEV
jgi:O-antigen/teichoic acid export membrane protein